MIITVVRHTLYEQPTQHIPKTKRMEILSARKVSPGVERQYTRERNRLFSSLFDSLKFPSSDFTQSKYSNHLRPFCTIQSRLKDSS